MAITVFDAGAVIAALDRADLFHDQVRRRLEDLLAAGERLVLPASAYAEALARPWLRGPESVAAADRSIAGFGFRITAVDERVAREAAGLRAKHGSRFRLPDALVIATALAQGSDRVITTDGGWPSSLAVTVEVLRPR
jgi:predicted nucleic acid-binding protein